MTCPVNVSLNGAIRTAAPGAGAKNPPSLRRSEVYPLVFPPVLTGGPRHRAGPRPGNPDQPVDGCPVGRPQCDRPAIRPGRLAGDRIARLLIACWDSQQQAGGVSPHQVEQRLQVARDDGGPSLGASKGRSRQLMTSVFPLPELLALDDLARGTRRYRGQ